MAEELSNMPHADGRWPKGSDETRAAKAGSITNVSKTKPQAKGKWTGNSNPTATGRGF